MARPSLYSVASTTLTDLGWTFMMTRLGSSIVGGNQNLRLWVGLHERYHHFYFSFTTSGSSNSASPSIS